MACISSGSSYSSQNLRMIVDSEYCPPESCDVSLRREKTPGLWSKHLSICSLICVPSSDSVLDPELSPDHIAALFHFRKRFAPVSVPCSTRDGWWSSEAWCTKRWHAMGPAWRDAAVDDYSRCRIGSTDSLRQQTADVCVHRQSWI